MLTICDSILNGPLDKRARGLVLTNALSGKDKETDRVYVTIRQEFKGVGRKLRGYEFLAGDGLPLIIQKPKFNTRPSKDRTEAVFPIKNTFSDTHSIRLWQGDLAITSVNRDGSIEVRYHDMTFTLPAGQEKALPGGSKTMRVVEWGLDSALIDHGPVNFQTGLTLHNHGFVEVEHVE